MTDSVSVFLYGLRYSRLRDVLRGRLDASLDWRNSIVMAELPVELTEAVQQVVNRTRLWRREKADVAAELVAHFQDGLAAGRSPEELLGTFGDPKAAAQLIRRAKKRGRPAMWRLCVYGVMGIVLLLLVYITTGLWMASGRPSIKTDYLATFNKPVMAVPEDQRAWPLYRDALLKMGMQEKDDSARSKLGPFDAKPGDAEWEKLASFLGKHHDSIAQLREAAAKPNLGFVASTTHADFSPTDRELFQVTVTQDEIDAAKKRPLEDRWLISTLLPDLQFLGNSGRLLASDARRAAAAGDGKTAAADIRATFGVSRHCEELPFLVCLLVAEAVQKKSLEAIRGILTDNPKIWSDEQLRELAHQLAASRIDWRRGFSGERTCFYDSMQRIYTDNGHGDGRLALQVTPDQNLFQLIESVATGGRAAASMFSNGGIALLTLPAANLAVAGRQDMTDMYNHVTDRALARLGTPYWTWASEPSLDDEVKAINDGPISRFRYLFVVLLTPSYDTMLNRVVASDAERDSVLVGLALELYHRDHNKWPESLGELSPRWLPTVPVDPISGKPLHYKIVNDRPLVYSVGVDGDDDGGRLAKSSSGEIHPEYAEPKHFGPDHESVGAPETDGDWVLWTTAKSG